VLICHTWFVTVVRFDGCYTPRVRSADMTTSVRWRRTVVAGLVASAATLLVTGCGSSAAGGQSGANPSASTTSGPAPLVVYSSQGYDAPVTKAFTAATGIPV